MASSSSLSKTPCAACGNKGAGIFRCEGCIQVFCRKHLSEHRDLLSHQLDEIVIQHDTLQQTIHEYNDKQNNQHPILKQIDKWEIDSIIRIQQVAEETRQKAKTLTGSQKVPKELHDLAERLQKARINDDYMETDLRTWATMLEKLKNDVKTPSSSIRIGEDPTQVLVAKIFLATSEQHSEPTERFGQSYGDILIKENGLVALQCGPKNSNTYVRGTGEYSSGKHNVRFLFKKGSITRDTSFHVISKSKLISEVTFKSFYQVYGWTSKDAAFPFDAEVPMPENFRDMSGQTTLEIEFHLDCDNRKISYVNQRTKNHRELKVDIRKCPFPWQVGFHLFEIGDYVRFLP